MKTRIVLIVLVMLLVSVGVCEAGPGLYATRNIPRFCIGFIICIIIYGIAMKYKR